MLPPLLGTLLLGTLVRCGRTANSGEVVFSNEEAASTRGMHDAILMLIPNTRYDMHLTTRTRPAIVPSPLLARLDEHPVLCALWRDVVTTLNLAPTQQTGGNLAELAQENQGKNSEK